MGKDKAVSSLALIALAVAIGAAGATWFSGREAIRPEARPRIPPSASSLETAAAASVPAGVPGPPPIDRVITAPTLTGGAPQPVVAPAPDPALPSEAATSSLEDVVSRVMPAVVAIQAGDARGSGFYIQPDTLLTNAHVVGSSSTVTVRRADGTTTYARVERLATQYDIAVLKVSNPLLNQAVLRLGSALTVRPGQEVIAVGSALGTLQNTVTRGIVSALRQSGSAMLIQTDAAVNPGNSGGPLLDRTGTVLGIATMGYPDRQRLSFAVAIDHAQSLLSDRPASQAPPAWSASGGDLQGLSPAIASARDQARASGEKTMQESLARLAQRADALDDYWRRFRESCYPGPVTGKFGREWFAVFDRGALTGPVAPGCGSTFDEIKEYASDIRDAVLAAEEAARQADVYPGVRRDARQSRRLDYAGWDR
ncbi:MAG: trypsin-like serine protease [Luteitalea sp.]|nr:trypsin-like serine protease [Luteitalea sp.]